MREASVLEHPVRHRFPRVSCLVLRLGERVVEVEHEVTLKVVSSELERVVRRRTDVSCHTGPIDVTEAPDFHQNWEEILRRQREEDEAEERGALSA